MNARTTGIMRRLLAAAAICAVEVAGAETTPPTALEDAFWACDYIATTRGTSAAPAETCMAIYEEVKATKFEGDFDALLAWWQVKRAGAYARMAEAIASAPVTPAASAQSQAVPPRPSRATRLLAATRAYFSELAAAMRTD